MLNQISDQLRASISNGNTAIFCGAGISFNSGLPIVPDLVKKILSELDLTEKDASIILNSNIPFEFFVETIKNEVDVDEILDIFSYGEPNTNHNLIAELVMVGFIKTVLTTNFDLLIEKALINRGLKEGADFEVFACEKEFGWIDWNVSKVRIIKIHGSISDKNEMAVTLSAVANKTTGINKNMVVERFFSREINPNVIVIGYSCSDLFDISPLLENLNGGSEILLVEHISSSDCRIESISKKEFKNPFKSFSGQRLIVNTDYFIKMIWEQLVAKPYRFVSSDFSWSGKVNDWMSRAIERNSVGVKHHVPARLYYNIGEYEHSVKHCERGISIAQTQGNQVTFYSELGNLGMALNALGKYSEARRCLEESVNACQDIGNTQGESAQSQALGNIYRNLGEFDSAIRAYLRAISIADREKDLQGLCTSIGNLASVYTHTEQPNEAVKHLTKGLEIACYIGNKQSEGSMLCSMGIAYFQIGDIAKAVQYIENSIGTTRLIGDRQGECMALLNLSNVNLQIEDFKSCLKNATAALELATSIGIKQSQAGAYYNIGSAYFFGGDSKSATQNFRNAVEIYMEIYGNTHRHTQAAIKALMRSENFPEHNKITKMNLI